jgi:hypothetical protein
MTDERVVAPAAGYGFRLRSMSFGGRVA